MRLRRSALLGLRRRRGGLEAGGRRDRVRHARTRTGPEVGARAAHGAHGDGPRGLYRAGYARSGGRGTVHAPRRRGDQGALRPLSRAGGERAGDSLEARLPRGGVVQRRGGLETALRARRHRPGVYRHAVAQARADGRVRHGARQARGRRSARRAVARGVLAAGEHRREVPAPLHDARELRL